MGKIQNITENMPNAWKRSDHSDGYILSFGIIDVTCYGAFKRKSVEEAKQLIEDLSKCNYRAPSETLGSSSKLKGGLIKLNQMTAVEEKLDALMNKIGNHKRRMHSANEVGTFDENEKKNSDEKGLSYEGPYQVEEA